MPLQVKAQIFDDCTKLANEPGKSISSARAAFQCGLCYVMGFGASHDPTQASQMFELSASKGFKVAELYLPSLVAIKQGKAVDHETCMLEYQTSNRRVLRHKWAHKYFSHLPADVVDNHLQKD